MLFTPTCRNRISQPSRRSGTRNCRSGSNSDPSKKSPGLSGMNLRRSDTHNGSCVYRPALRRSSTHSSCGEDHPSSCRPDTYSSYRVSPRTCTSRHRIAIKNSHSPIKRRAPELRRENREPASPSKLTAHYTPVSPIRNVCGARD
jgi:hypothetical protein